VSGWNPKAASGSSGSGVSSFNSRTGAVTFEQTDLASAIAPGTSGNVLTSNGTAWTSAAPTAAGVSSYNSRTGAVVPLAADLVAAVAPGTTGNVLTSSAGSWVSSALPANVSSYNSRTGAVVPIAADLAAAVAPGANGNILTASGGAWTSAAPAVSGVTSFNSRTGAVTPGNADYLAVATGGLTGATAATRYVGGTTSGAPVSGTFAVGDFIIDQTGVMWICTVAGTPGTWVDPAASAGVSSYNSRTGAVTPQAADLAAAVTPGASGNLLTSNGSAWTSAAPAASVTSFDSRTGAVTLTAADLNTAVAVGASGNVLTSNGSAWTSAAPAVSSYNSRTGAVTPQAADLAAAVTPGTSGNVLTSNGSAWTSAAPPAASVIVATQLGTYPISIGTIPTTLLLITGLTVGTWIVRAHACVLMQSATTNQVDVYMAASSGSGATYTISGPACATVSEGGTGLTTRFAVSFTCVLTVTSIANGTTADINVVGTAAAGTVQASGSTETSLAVTGAIAQRAF
jgi:hypothetical protein